MYNSSIMRRLINKMAKLVFNLLGLPYYIVKKLIEYGIEVSKIIINGVSIVVKSLIKVIKKVVDVIVSVIKAIIDTTKNILKFIYTLIKKFIKFLPKVFKGIFKWFVEAVKESIAQIFTLLGFFIAWLTLTGSAKDIVGIAILISTALWLLTINLREE